MSFTFSPTLTGNPITQKLYKEIASENLLVITPTTTSAQTVVTQQQPFVKSGTSAGRVILYVILAIFGILLLFGLIYGVLYIINPTKINDKKISKGKTPKAPKAGKTGKGTPPT